MGTRVWCLLLFVCVVVGRSNANTANYLTEDQVGKLISAIWEKPVTSIDVTLYKEIIKPPRNIEDIRKEVTKEFEEMVEIENLLEKPGLTIDKFDIESEFKRRVELYNQPRLMKERMRIDGYLYRLDQTSITPDMDLESELDIHTTYVNSGNKEKNDYTHFSYEHKFKQAKIDNSKKSVWVEHRVDEWIGMPKPISDFFKKVLSQSNIDPEWSTSTPGVDAISKLINGEIKGFRVEIDTLEIDNQIVDKITVSISPQNKKIFCLTVDKENYSRVYNFEMYLHQTGNLYYCRETKEFGKEGYPRQIHTIKYNHLGKIVKETRIVVEKVDLEPENQAELFKFTVPPGYTMVDDRLSPALIIEAMSPALIMEPVENDLSSQATNVQEKEGDVSIHDDNNKTSLDNLDSNSSKKIEHVTKETIRSVGQEKQITDSKLRNLCILLLVVLVFGIAIAYKFTRR